MDTNILVYADREELALHAPALERLHGLAEGDEPFALPAFCVGEFLRVVSHPALFEPPTPVLEALDSVESLLASPVARLLLPGERFLPLLRRMLTASGAQGNLVFDAQIAAVCVENGARTLLTEDRDFTRFPGLEVLPLS